MKHFTIDSDNNIVCHASRKAAKETGAGVFSTEEQFTDLIGPDSKRLVEVYNTLPGVQPVTKFANRKTACEKIWRAIQQLGGPAAEPAQTTEVTDASQVPEPETPFDPIEATPDPVASKHQAPIETAAAQVEVPPTPAPVETVEPVATGSAQVLEVALPAATTTTKATPVKKARKAQPEATADADPDAIETAGEGQTNAAGEVPEATATAAAQGPDVAPAEAKASKKATRPAKAAKAPKETKAAKSEGIREGSKTAQVVALLKHESGATLQEIMTKMNWQRHTVRGFMAGAMKKAGFTVESFKPEGGERTYRINS